MPGEEAFLLLVQPQSIGPNRQPINLSPLTSLALGDRRFRLLRPLGLVGDSFSGNAPRLRRGSPRKLFLGFHQLVYLVGVPPKQRWKTLRAPHRVDRHRSWPILQELLAVRFQIQLGRSGSK